MRFMGHSDTLLCPSGVLGQATGKTFYIQILGFNVTTDYTPFFDDVAKVWFTLGGLPHWHKEWTFLTNAKHFLHLNYQGNLNKFEEIRKALDVDPDDLFRNETMTNLFEI